MAPSELVTLQSTNGHWTFQSQQKLREFLDIPASCRCRGRTLKGSRCQQVLSVAKHASISKSLQQILDEGLPSRTAHSCLESICILSICSQHGSNKDENGLPRGQSASLYEKWHLSIWKEYLKANNATVAAYAKPPRLDCLSSWQRAVGKFHLHCLRMTMQR